MGLADELERLEALRTRGVLNHDEFEQAKRRILEEQYESRGGGTGSGPFSGLDQFRRSSHDRWLGGVCGGLGELTSVPSWVWRLVFALSLCYAGAGAVVYILLWALVPERTDR